MSDKKKYLRWLRDILVVLLIVLGIQWWQARDLPAGMAPSLAGPGLQGEPVSLAQHQGKPVLLYFWATWCPVCSFTSGNIASIAEDYAVLTIASTSGDAQEIRAHLTEKGLDMPVIMDESGDLARRWDVFGLPAIFIVNSRGEIAYAGMGYSSELGLRVRLAFAD